MLITIGEGENRIVRDTEYEIGDYVTVYEHGRAQLKEMDTTMYRPKWRDIPMLKDTDLPCYPIEVNTRYKITDITISAATGHITYHLNYSNPRVVFPSGSRSAEENEVCAKVPDDDYENDPAVIASQRYEPSKELE